MITMTLKCLEKVVERTGPGIVGRAAQGEERERGRWCWELGTRGEGEGDLGNCGSKSSNGQQDKEKKANKQTYIQTKQKYLLLNK